LPSFVAHAHPLEGTIRAETISGAIVGAGGGNGTIAGEIVGIARADSVLVARAGLRHGHGDEAQIREARVENLHVLGHDLGEP